MTFPCMKISGRVFLKSFLKRFCFCFYFAFMNIMLTMVKKSHNCRVREDPKCILYTVGMYLHQPGMYKDLAVNGGKLLPHS